MQSVLTYLENVLATYWGQSKYQLFLYIAIIVILLLEKEAWKKITFGWYGIVCFIGLLNPITVKITSKVWGESVAYYCRQVSLIPIFIIIAYGIMRLLSIVEKKRKLILATFMTMFIVVNGYRIYQEAWYTKADDCSKIPAQIIELSEFFKEQDGVVRIAASTNISAYLRQYENVILVQGRRVCDEVVERELQSEQPNVMEIMQYTGQLGCDYIIVEGDELVQETYRTAGYEECFKTQNYLVYKVEGVKRWKYVYDKENCLVEKKYMNEKGDISCADVGYAIEKNTYDLNGKLLSVYYYDEKGKPTKTTRGNASARYYYKKNGEGASVIYYDTDGKKTNISEGYAEALYQYDSSGTFSKIEYYDNDGKMVRTEQFVDGEKKKSSDHVE